MENNKDSKIIKFLNGKTFYVVLCICFVAVGIAAWAGLNGIKSNLKDSSSKISSNLSSDRSPTTELPSFPQIIEKEDTVPESNTNKNDNKETPTEPNEPETETTDTSVAAFFIKPVLGETLKGFSDTELQYSMTYGDLRLHKALDIAAEAGTPVTAAGNGKVTSIYNDPLLGTTVEIDHGNKITAKYCGLNKVPTVKVGDTVDSSTELGTIDVIPCESVEKRHLHLEFFIDQKAVSPLEYFTE